MFSLKCLKQVHFLYFVLNFLPVVITCGGIVVWSIVVAERVMKKHLGYKRDLINIF